MAKGRARSAVTGRYITKSAAARSPQTSIVSSKSRGSGGARNRSAITGKFISKAAAARHPSTSVREGGR